MSNPNSLRLDTELDAIGVSGGVIDALGARTDTDAFGLQALRQGIVDAARAWEGETDFTSAEDVRETAEYSMGFDANTTVLFKRTDGGMEA